ncbi:unnamed protein product [Microthlaspi erraticum]|uniref:Retrotransposon gag domain-containing protein n=1 Tax=Microthlaspi erraticum TaxID=1685480 RepID=A0A6D2J8S5_9BRAS|nr:unnamed protein product [Microthlaspi erraticum]
MSLADKAHQWEKSLPHGTITTWDECKKAFLAKFFSTGRTAKLRGEISSFIQRNNETFAEAWERFKGYTSQCPHHGFNNESLLSTLYRGCLPRYREMLDTASNGNFLNQDVDDGWQLVENMAISTECYGEHYESTDGARPRTRSSWSSDEKRHACTQLEVGQTDPSPIPCQACQLCLRTNLVKDQEGEETTQEGKPKVLEMNNKLVEIHSKLESLTSRVQIIESSSASSSSPQEYAQAVTLRSGQFPSRGSPPQIAVDIDDEEGEDLVDYADNTTRTRSSWNKTLNQNSIELKKLRHCKTNQSSIEQKRADKASSSQPTKPVAKKKDTPSGPPPYKPPLPFPGRFKKQLLEAHKAKFDELMRQLELKLPFIDALMLIPPYQKFLKDAVQQRTREAQGMVVLTRECSAIIQRKVISDKKEDPGSFTLPACWDPYLSKTASAI